LPDRSSEAVVNNPFSAPCLQQRTYTTDLDRPSFLEAA
jgi:hypothetical protein